MTASLALLLAQAPPPIVSGDAAGWTGAGLLGLVLAWLFFKHLPTKDKQIDDLIHKQADWTKTVMEHIDDVVDKKDRQIDQQRAEFTLTLNTMTTAFRSEMTAARVATEGHFKALAETMNNALSQLGRQLSEHSLRNQQWLDTLKKEIEERKAAIARGDK